MPFGDYAPGNHWIQPYQTTYMRVYAGELVMDPSQGVIVVVIDALSGADVPGSG